MYAMKQQKRSVKHDIMAQDAVRIASGWLWKNLPDRFGPSDPKFDAQRHRWRVPVVLAYPELTAGEVGEIVVDGSSGDIVYHTDLAELRAAGLKLGRKHRTKVRAAFLRARNARL